MTMLRSLALAATLLSATTAKAFFVDGDGHYALRGETQTQPGFQKNTGTYQAIEQSFRLRGEVRVSDQSSLFLEFHLFDDPRSAYMGDKPDPRTCKENQRNPSTREVNLPCDYQDSSEPHYKPYVPQITKAYVRYAFDYCVVEAGRRPRDWGLGIFLDSGEKPFATSASTFDGVTCDINIQKTQTLGLSVGYDKLQETGSAADLTETGVPRGYGPADGGDDLDQYFFTIQYDDRKANAGAAFTKQVGVYFAQVSSRKLGDGGSSTDMKYLDLYTGFFFSDLSLRNEILFRMGKSGDPNWRYYGGLDYANGDAAVNNVQSIGVAGELKWTLSRAGAAIGPADYNKGDASSHSLFFDYAYAPGDSSGDGYKPLAERNTKVTAMAFNRNYKPALLLFNQHPAQDNMIVDGQFNPSRVMNATVFGTGYRYESMAAGNVEVKLVTAQLANNSIDTAHKASIAAAADANATSYHDANNTAAEDAERTKRRNARPAGFFGKSLGYELDVAYGYKFGKEADVGAAIGAAMPGDAWKIDEKTRPSNNFLLQTYGAFHF
jgi:hypothetical protein